MIIIIKKNKKNMMLHFHRLILLEELHFIISAITFFIVSVITFFYNNK